MVEHYITTKNYSDYEVSNLGNVRNKRTGTVRKQTDRKGYRKIRINGRDVSIHRLVADSFFDGDHSDLQVNHIDGNKANNHISNLEWVTPSENVKHAYNNGLKHFSGGPEYMKVMDESTGKKYDSAVDCARDIGGTGPGVIYALNHSGRYKGRKLKRYEET